MPETRPALGVAHRELAAQLARIGGQPDRDEWWMSGATLNAYHNARQNTVTIPAANLASPYFDRDADASVNPGAIGALLGHQLTHGYDSFGRHYDWHGNMRDWWTAKDASNFAARAGCLADQYSQYIAVDDVKVSGERTVAENTADVVGLRLALTALRATPLVAQKTQRVGAFTSEQQFFLSYGLTWCTNTTREALRDLASNN